MHLSKVVSLYFQIFQRSKQVLTKILLQKIQAVIRHCWCAVLAGIMSRLVSQEAAEGIEAVLLDEHTTSGIVVRPAPWLQAAAVLLSRAHAQNAAVGEDGSSLVSDTFR